MTDEELIDQSLALATQMTDDGYAEEAILILGAIEKSFED